MLLVNNKTRIEMPRIKNIFKIHLFQRILSNDKRKLRPLEWNYFALAYRYDDYYNRFRGISGFSKLVKLISAQYS